MYWRAVNWIYSKEKWLSARKKADIRDLQAACNFKYRLWGDVSLFAEPRTSLASHSLKTNEKERRQIRSQKFTDNLYSINIGIEIQRTDENRIRSF